MRALAALLCASALASCSYYTEHKFATFGKAVQMPRTTPGCPVYWDNANVSKLPAASPFAQINGTFDSGSNASFAADLRAWAEDLGWHPDFIVYRREGASYAGSTSSYIGFGVSVSTPNYRQNAIGLCFRIAPASTGIRANQSLMVTQLSDEARACGLIEGDTLLTIDGASVEASGAGKVSEWLIRQLEVLPGETVKVVWVRPGVGRMDGDLVMQPNRPFPGDASPMDMKPPPLRNNKARKWRRGA